MTKIRSKLVLTASLALLSACAPYAEKVKPAHVSSLHYREFDCEQLRAESKHLNDRIETAAAAVDARAENQRNAWKSIYHPYAWPILLFVPFSGSKSHEVEYAQLKGEHAAIQSASDGKSCSEKVRGGS